MAFSMAAEIERDLISQRTKEALRFKKAQGKTRKTDRTGEKQTRSVNLGFHAFIPSSCACPFSCSGGTHSEQLSSRKAA
jgi:DNA invertase Pin-like site-specific DNA recombinase